MKIDVNLLLTPISDAELGGRNMEYELVYDEIRQARESDPDYLPQGEWVTELRKADWSKVVRLSSQVLSRDSKDFQIACWLVEGVSQQQGTEGLLTGLNFLTTFIAQFWQNGWPALDDDGAIIRHSILNRLDRQLSQLLRLYPLTGQPESTLEHWLKVLAYEHSAAMSPGNADDNNADGDFTMETFNRWAASLAPEILAQQSETLNALQQGMNAFETLYAQLNPEAESLALGQTRNITTDLQDYIKRLFDRAAPAYDDVMTLNVLSPVQEDRGMDAGIQMNTSQKQVMSRDLAISQMLTIAHFFRQTEPSSPVPFLMERAARWAGMTLTEWLEEMLEDDGSMRHINKILKGQD